MNGLENVVKTIIDLGPIVMMPVILLILGLLFRLRFSKALRSALIVGVGFAGIYTMIGFFMDNITPAAVAMAQNGSSHLNIIDLGWPISAAIAFASPIAFIFIPIGLVVNLILLTLKVTKTLDIDIWDYWHFILAGTFVYAVTDNLVWGLVAAAIYLLLILVLADATQPMVSSFFNLPNISFALAGNVELAILFWPINKLLDKIPFLRNFSLTPEYIRSKLGVIGEPVFQGAVLGAILGILARYSWEQVLVLAMNMAAAIVIIPKMVAILMEALIPISEAAGDFMRKATGAKRVLFIGMDAAIGTGHPAIIANGLLMVPITILIAMLLPWNHILPLSDLSALVFCLMFAVVVSKGDMLRSLIMSIFFTIMSLSVATWTAPYFAKAAALSQIALPESADGAVGISALSTGAEPFQLLLAKMAELPTPLLIVSFTVITALLIVTGVFVNRKHDREVGQDPVVQNPVVQNPVEA